MWGEIRGLRAARGGRSGARALASGTSIHDAASEYLVGFILSENLGLQDSGAIQIEYFFFKISASLSFA
jgi:hypothetical protein